MNIIDFIFRHILLMNVYSNWHMSENIWEKSFEENPNGITLDRQTKVPLFRYRGIMGAKRRMQLYFVVSCTIF